MMINLIMLVLASGHKRGTKKLYVSLNKKGSRMSHNADQLSKK